MAGKTFDEVLQVWGQMCDLSTRLRKQDRAELENGIAAATDGVARVTSGHASPGADQARAQADGLDVQLDDAVKGLIDPISKFGSAQRALDRLPSMQDRWGQLTTNITALRTQLDKPEVTLPNWTGGTAPEAYKGSLPVQQAALQDLSRLADNNGAAIDQIRQLNQAALNAAHKYVSDAYNTIDKKQVTPNTFTPGWWTNGGATEYYFYRNVCLCIAVLTNLVPYLTDAADSEKGLLANAASQVSDNLERMRQSVDTVTANGTQARVGSGAVKTGQVDTNVGGQAPTNLDQGQQGNVEISG